MLALRLFLPESWTSKRARLERAGVPTEYRTARTKPEMALAEIDRVIAAGVRFGYVLADAGYGISAAFHQGLTARELAWAVGIPRHLKVYPADVRMIWPVAGRGRPRQRRRVAEASTSVRGGRRTRAEPLWKRHPFHCAASPKWHAYLKTNQIRCIGRGGSE
jgi:SRSO17 transposase